MTYMYLETNPSERRQQRIKQFKQRQKNARLIILFAITIFILHLIPLFVPNPFKPKDLNIPIPEEHLIKNATDVAESEEVNYESLKVVDLISEPKIIIGTASWYSLDGCLGCREDRIMYNGETLSDSRATVSMPYYLIQEYNLLNKLVTIENLENGKTIEVPVTDTGLVGRVADLSLATKNTLDCGDLCKVKITFNHD